jgi:hypothetical protein
MPLSRRAREELERQRREAERLWTVRIRLPADTVNPGRTMARVLKALGRRYRVRCVAIMENHPAQRVETD